MGARFEIRPFDIHLLEENMCGQRGSRYKISEAKWDNRAYVVFYEYNIYLNRADQNQSRCVRFWYNCLQIKRLVPPSDH